MDRLIEAIERVNNPSVVGLDPTLESLPVQLIEKSGEQGRSITLQADQLAQSYFRFNKTVIDAVADIVPAVKVQIAMYEALGPRGIDTYVNTCRYAHEKGLYVIGDIKRGDIGSTALAYARHLSGRTVVDRPVDTANPVPCAVHGEAASPVGTADEHKGMDCGKELWFEDAVTVNPFLGVDGIAPFIEAACRSDKDLFVLVRTSNPSSDEIQELPLADGSRVYERVGTLVGQWGNGSIGRRGYSRVGAVVGAIHGIEGRLLRQALPHTFFLIPGYGAQGGTAHDLTGMFDHQGSGAIVNSSRGIIGAWRKDAAYRSDMNEHEVLELVAASSRRMAVAMRKDLMSMLSR